MKKLLLGAAVVSTVALGAPAASADPGHYYQGGCGYWAVPDSSPNQVLGGQNAWTGSIFLTAQSTDGAANNPSPTVDPIYIRCDVYKNDVLMIFDALDASSAVGTVADWDNLQYTAEPNDVITLCEYVVVGTHPVTYHGC